jgi:hypothetical protein
MITTTEQDLEELKIDIRWFIGSAQLIMGIAAGNALHTIRTPTTEAHALEVKTFEELKQLIIKFRDMTSDLIKFKAEDEDVWRKLYNRGK